MAAKLRITLRRSLIGRLPKQRATVRALGLRKINSSVEKPDNPGVRGMVTIISHMVEVEEFEQADQ